MENRIEELEAKLHEQAKWLMESMQEQQRIKPLYERFCRSPFYWFIRPLDAGIDNRELMQCDCGKVFWMDSKAEFTTHRGHHYRLAIETSVWIYIKARYLPSWI
jgi:hypothetical protein|tara:strand:- start:210 stop:521 length:312 start_codon:yes stop_codon:yes gene_type:complete